MCQDNNGEIATSQQALQIICAPKGKDYSVLSKSISGADIAKMKAIKKEAQAQYLVALHFTGLNKNTWEELKRDVNNGWIIHKNDTMPKRINQMILLCNKHKSETKRRRSATRVDPMENGVACVHPGKEEPGVAVAQS